MKIAFFGSGIAPAGGKWPTHYYRGVVKALARRGHQVTFFQPEDTERGVSVHPEWCQIVEYTPTIQGIGRMLDIARNCDLVIKAAGTGVLDRRLEESVAELSYCLTAFWDMNPAVTLSRLASEPSDSLRELLPLYDLILTYGGAEVVNRYRDLGAHLCQPIYDGLDSESTFPVAPDPRFQGSLGYLNDRLPGTEERVEEFFFHPARLLDRPGVLGGNGWQNRISVEENVRYLGQVEVDRRNAFYSTPLAILNLSLECDHRDGYLPTSGVFEAAGAGACLIVDETRGVERFFALGKEILVAKNGHEVASLLRKLSPRRARAIGRAARRRALAHHTYLHRVLELEEALTAACRLSVERKRKGPPLAEPGVDGERVRV